MSVEEIVRLKQEDHVKNEKEILASIKHPFIVNL
jgi:protein kinase X